jgi:hypothetical protein
MSSVLIVSTSDVCNRNLDDRLVGRAPVLQAAARSDF